MFNKHRDWFPGILHSYPFVASQVKWRLERSIVPRHFWEDSPESDVWSSSPKAWWPGLVDCRNFQSWSVLWHILTNFDLPSQGCLDLSQMKTKWLQAITALVFAPAMPVRLPWQPLWHSWLSHPEDHFGGKNVTLAAGFSVVVGGVGPWKREDM